MNTHKEAIDVLTRIVNHVPDVSVLGVDPDEIRMALIRPKEVPTHAAPTAAELAEALVKVLDAGDLEAKAHRALQNARENFSDSSDESKALGRAMLAASTAEREARLLLATLKAPNVAGNRAAR